MAGTGTDRSNWLVKAAPLDTVPSAALFKPYIGDSLRPDSDSEPILLLHSYPHCADDELPRESAMQVAGEDGDADEDGDGDGDGDGEAA